VAATDPAMSFPGRGMQAGDPLTWVLGVGAFLDVLSAQVEAMFD
jgi:hypothetical protein